MTLTALKPTATAATPAALWFLNTRITLQRSAGDGPDGLCLVEHHMPCGDSPPQHVHHTEDEVFHILEGVLRLKVGDAERVLKAGDWAVAPKGVPHAFTAVSPEGVRLLTLTAGPDFEGLLRDASRPAEGPGLPEAIEPTPEMQADLARIAAAHRIDLIGPPLGL